MGALRDRMIEEMKLRNFSAATQKTYLYAVTRLAKYYRKAPDQLSKEDIRAFLVHLIVERKLSPNGLTGYCSGLRFFYNETLGWDENKLFITPRRKSSPLLVVALTLLAVGPTLTTLTAAVDGALSNWPSLT